LRSVILSCGSLIHLGEAHSIGVEGAKVSEGACILCRGTFYGEGVHMLVPWFIGMLRSSSLDYGHNTLVQKQGVHYTLIKWDSCNHQMHETLGHLGQEHIIWLELDPRV
jgi:hypothetical protein